MRGCERGSVIRGRACQTGEQQIQRPRGRLTLKFSKISKEAVVIAKSVRWGSNKAELTRGLKVLRGSHLQGLIPGKYTQVELTV